MESTALRPSNKQKTFEPSKFWLKLQDTPKLSKLSEDDRIAFMFTGIDPS